MIKTIDKTSGKRPGDDEKIYLTVEFHTGGRYVYSGKTKKEATDNFKKKWGNFRGFLKKEWEIE